MASYRNGIVMCRPFMVRLAMVRKFAAPLRGASAWFFCASYALLDSSSKNFVHSNPSAAAIRFAIFTDGRLLSLSIEA
jgi:hypothetical protein